MDQASHQPRLFGDHFLRSLADDEQQLIERLRGLCRSHFGPQAAEVARQDVFAWDTFKLLAREGIVATAFPKACGGSAAASLPSAAASEALTEAPAFSARPSTSMYLAASTSPGRRVSSLPSGLNRINVRSEAMS